MPTKKRQASRGLKIFAAARTPKFVLPEKHRIGNVNLPMTLRFPVIAFLIATALAAAPEPIQAKTPAAKPATPEKTTPNCPKCKKEMVFDRYEMLPDDGGGIFRIFICKECKTEAKRKRD